jgi:hypothetical protein
VRIEFEPPPPPESRKLPLTFRVVLLFVKMVIGAVCGITLAILASFALSMFR